MYGVRDQHFWVERCVRPTPCTRQHDLPREYHSLPTVGVFSALLDTSITYHTRMIMIKVSSYSECSTAQYQRHVGHVRSRTSYMYVQRRLRSSKYIYFLHNYASRTLEMGALTLVQTKGFSVSSVSTGSIWDSPAPARTKVRSAGPTRSRTSTHAGFSSHAPNLWGDSCSPSDGQVKPDREHCHR